MMARTMLEKITLPRGLKEFFTLRAEKFASHGEVVTSEDEENYSEYSSEDEPEIDSEELFDTAPDYYGFDEEEAEASEAI